MDRIDLAVDMPAVTAADLALPPPSEGSAEVAARVARARRLQVERAESLPDAPRGSEAINARAEGRFLETITGLDAAGRGLLAQAAEAGRISARGWTRCLRLARTIADLEGADQVRRVHVAEALAHRRAGWSSEEGPYAAPAAFVDRLDPPLSRGL